LSYSCNRYWLRTLWSPRIWRPGSEKRRKSTRRQWDMSIAGD